MHLVNFSMKMANKNDSESQENKSDGEDSFVTESESDEISRAEEITGKDIKSDKDKEKMVN